MKIEIGDVEQDHLFKKETREGRIKVKVKNKWYVVKFTKETYYDDLFQEYENEINFELPDELEEDGEEIEEILMNYFEDEGAR